MDADSADMIDMRRRSWEWETGRKGEGKSPLRGQEKRQMKNDKRRERKTKDKRIWIFNIIINNKLCHSSHRDAFGRPRNTPEAGDERRNLLRRVYSMKNYKRRERKTKDKRSVGCLAKCSKNKAIIVMPDLILRRSPTDGILYNDEVSSPQRA